MIPMHVEIQEALTEGLMGSFIRFNINYKLKDMIEFMFQTHLHVRITHGSSANYKWPHSRWAK